MPDLVSRPGIRGPAEQRQRAEVGGRGPGGPVQPGDRLEVVVQHVGPRREDRVERGGIALAVGDQHLDRACPGSRARTAAIGGGEARGAAVGEVVAGHAGDHRVLEAERRDRVGDPAGFVGIER